MEVIIWEQLKPGLKLPPIKAYFDDVNTLTTTEGKAKQIHEHINYLVEAIGAQFLYQWGACTNSGRKTNQKSGMLLRFFPQAHSRLGKTPSAVKRPRQDLVILQVKSSYVAFTIYEISLGVTYGIWKCIEQAFSFKLLTMSSNQLST